jgi:hypothetical protein
MTSLLFSGLKAFDANNFTEAGRVHQKRFLAASFVFLGVCLLGAAGSFFGAVR